LIGKILNPDFSVGIVIKEKKEAVSNLRDSLFLFGGLMETKNRLSNAQAVHFIYETASFFL